MFLRKKRTPQAPHSTLGGFRGQGVSRPTGAKVVHVRARSHPTPTPPHPTHSRALFPAASLPVDVVAGPGEPDSPGLIEELGLRPCAGR